MLTLEHLAWSLPDGTDIVKDISLTAKDADSLRGNEQVKKLVGDKQIRKLIYVPGRLVNVVVG